MKHLIKTMKFTVRNSGHLCRTSIILLLAMLCLLLAGPVDAREFASFKLEVEQDGDFWGAESASAQIKKKMTQVESSWPPGMFLNISYFQGEFNGDGAVCFLEGVYPGPFVVSQERDGSARVDFYFVADGTNGSPDHKYVLHLFGLFSDETNFPPALDDTIVTMFATDWEMSTEGRGQDRKNTCRGEGVFSTDVTVTVERTG